MLNQEELPNNFDYVKKILENRERIISLFIKIVRQRMPSAKDVEDTILENSLFEFLTSVAKLISYEGSDDREVYQENVQISREHGLSRSQIPSYTLDQVISEFRILRSIIFSLLEEMGPLTPPERDNLLFAIDNGLTQAATEFSHNRGFKDARLSEEINAKNIALNEVNSLRDEGKKREQFFSTVTHDMRNPLSIAKASAEIILKRTLDRETLRKHVVRIIKSIDRSNLMIQDLLDSNKLRSGGKIFLKKEECDLSAIIKEACEDLSQVYGTRFKLEDFPAIKGRFDCNGLKRALENLLTNAIKYGANNRPITVSLEETKTEIQIHVHNEGNPIPLEKQESLFKLYHRSEAQEETQQGWGIGLALVKGIAEAHDGKIEVRSSKEEGTRFSIILPHPSNLPN